MPTVEIKLTVPEGTVVQIVGLDEPTVDVIEEVPNSVERYFTKYLSDNGRKVFAAAARIEDFRGKPGFTLEDVAHNLSVSYATVKSWHRTSGRSAKRWRSDTGTQEPIRFEWLDYREVETGGSARTIYRLPSDVAETIKTLPITRAEEGADS